MCKRTYVSARTSGRKTREYYLVNFSADALRTLAWTNYQMRLSRNLGSAELAALIVEHEFRGIDDRWEAANV